MWLFGSLGYSISPFTVVPGHTKYITLHKMSKSKPKCINVIKKGYCVCWGYDAAWCHTWKSVSEIPQSWYEYW